MGLLRFGAGRKVWGGAQCSQYRTFDCAGAARVSGSAQSDVLNSLTHVCDSEACVPEH